jgi:hypothetical protein
MYKNNFIVAIMDSNGQILRERGDQVRQPFNQEYQIFLKNLDSRRANVNIFINGQDSLDGNSIIVKGNSSTKVEGFMKGNVVTHRFKFVQKTSQIVEYQGDNIEHGFIRVMIRYEKLYQLNNYYPLIFHPISEQHPQIYYHYNTNCAGLVETSVSRCSATKDINNDEGLTVAGSDINRRYKHDYIAELELEQTIFTLQMLGIEDNGIAIKKPVLTRSRLRCGTCGTNNPTTHRFCSECGTNLTF